jgi:hypothetical protein
MSHDKKIFSRATLGTRAIGSSALVQCIRNSWLLAPPLTLSTMLERCKNWRHVFEDFVLICSRFSSNTTVLECPQKIHRFSFTVLDHPPYSLDLAPSDFYLIPNLKEHLIRRWSQDNCEHVTPSTRRTVLKWRTHETTWKLFISKCFDDGAVLLRSILWTLSIVSMFCNHNVSRDGSSLVIRWT